MQQEFLNSFARRVGKSLSKTHQELIEKEFGNYNIKNHIIDKNNSYVLEIGSGHGDFIYSQAVKNPHIKYIACEPYINGVAKLLEKITENKIDNVYIWNDDVRLLLEDLPDRIFDKVFILFPDPWPKKKQKKRRIINEYLLNKLKYKLKEKGVICTATDDADYAKSILLTFDQNSDFEWDLTRDFHKSFDDNVITHYQMKANLEDRKCYFFEFVLIFLNSSGVSNFIDKA